MIRRLFLTSLLRSSQAFLWLALAFGAQVSAAATPAASDAFTIEQAMSYPYPDNLVAAPTGTRIAWTVNHRGSRNIWVAEGPDFKARQLTPYALDDGQELTSLQFSADGRHLVYVRGGEHSSNRARSVPVDPLSRPTPAAVQVCTVDFDSGVVTIVDDGDYPVLSRRGNRLAYLKGDAIWGTSLGSSEKLQVLIRTRGKPAQLAWSPDGARLAFVSQREDHAIIGIYLDAQTPILWLAPSTSLDSSPRWSPDGTRIAFVRRPGSGGTPAPAMEYEKRPWAIWTAEIRNGTGSLLWRSPATPRGILHAGDGGANLFWAAEDRIAFLSFMDGWQHLYSIPASGGEPLLLTPGEGMIEHPSLSADGRLLLAAINAGPEAADRDRRHLLAVPVDAATPRLLTRGTGLEWKPVVTGDGAHVAFISATPQRPPLPAVMPVAGGAVRLLARNVIPSDYPSAKFVTPEKVEFKAADGGIVFGQLFRPEKSSSKRPALLFLHGGPRRQMLLGWHNWDYYANFYALNQYLVSRGFVVLSVNYRLGIGYGYDFQYPPAAGWRGASQYQDVLAAADFLAEIPEVDPTRIGLYGASDGGYLTGLGLSRNSDRFVAGVDIHGVSDWTTLLTIRERWSEYSGAPDADEARQSMWNSSPVATIARWKSPVLVIHADDDRTNDFAQSIELVRRLEENGVPFEEIVIPDDTHHFLRHANWRKVNEATAAFLERHLKP